MNNCWQHKQGLRPHVAFVGFTVQDATLEAILANDRYMPVQTQKLSKAMVTGLVANGWNVDLISSEPVSAYPANPQFFVRGRTWVDDEHTTGASTTFVNIRLLRDLTRLLSCIRLLSKWLRKAPAPEIIFVYGGHTAHLLAALLVARLARIPVVMFLTDPVSPDLPGEGFMTRVCRHIDRAIFSRFAGWVDGTIGVTDEFRKYAGAARPFLRMEGILADTDAPQERTADSRAKRTAFFYAGGLEPAYGVTLLLDAFESHDLQQCELWIAGRGSMQEEVERRAARNDRIRYLGFVPPSSVTALLQSAHYLINARPSRQDVAHMSFPSKTLQFLVSGTPVISTQLPGIPGEYWDYMIAVNEESAEGIRATIQRVLESSYSEYERLGRRAQQFVLRYKTAAVQGRTLTGFLRQFI